MNQYTFRKKAFILLSDGTIFHGKSIGVDGTAYGELCFNTGMTGYQEIFTDPSYNGQLMVMANVHIGNYGTNLDEVESGSVKIAGLICKNFSFTHSRYGSSTSLFDFLNKNKIVTISDVDTRALVSYIRDNGAMNALITTENIDKLNELKKSLEKVPNMSGLELASKVSTKEPYFFGDENSTYKVAVLDLGIKNNILRNLSSRDCYMKEIIDSNKPLFGICLGHQVIALANGIKTYKMHNGHRGINHPVINLKTGKGEITSQNHGFAINRKDTEENKNIEITHLHLNDDTIAGIRHKNKDCFSVQFHPEASAGPHDSSYLFDEFVQMIKK